MIERALEALRGAVRPLLTLGGFTVASYLVVVGVVTAAEYMILVSSMVAFWFAERNKNNGNGNG